MNNLIKVQQNNNGENVVSGRELHKFLEVKTDYKDWFPRMLRYGFEEGLDFSSFLSESTGGRPSQDHILKMDMAKEISMIQRSEKGKQARQYFIRIEKSWKQQQTAPVITQEGMTAAFTNVAAAIMANVNDMFVTSEARQDAIEKKVEKMEDVITCQQIHHKNQIDQTRELIGLRSMNVNHLVELLKQKLTDLTGRKVKGTCYIYKKAKFKLFTKLKVRKWEDIKIDDYSKVTASIDSLECGTYISF